MTIFRVAFIVLSTAAIGGTSYVSYYGAGGESTDLDQSVRVASGGRVGGVVGRVK
ncbi:hypothetical protein [Tropicibacter oceani]|uniref:Uncharacterized protein n=1 Tax=Tropicibacter oceani TaxID=3058420 RepID=A0ABY8QJ36_9RHOB|nr:hypothetical protein [Tropicibacter oceani]WGW04655.1 hypothetical protein QF118_03645 [Tropicibacter oceani]